MKTNTRLLLLLLFFATSVNMAISATAVERECRYTDFSLTATPDKGIYGQEVGLSVSASNLPENGIVYQWLKWGIDDASSRETFVPISITTEGNLSYSIEQDTTTIIVVAEACVAKVQIKEITLSLEPIDRECNDIILQPIVRLGADEPISYKWQRSTDGITWEDLDPSAVEPVEIEGLEGCVKVTISEASMFRLAELDASGAETGLYSDTSQTILYEVKELELTAEPSTVLEEGGSIITITKDTNIEEGNGPEWYTVIEGTEYFLTATNQTLSVESLTETMTYKVVWDKCEATATVKVLKPMSLVVKERDCNKILISVETEDNNVDYKLQISKAETINGPWSEWEDFATNVNEIYVDIDSYTRIRLFYSEAAGAETEIFQPWSVELTIDKENISLGDEVTLTATSINIDDSAEYSWYENDNLVENTGNTFITKPYSSTIYKVVQNGCASNDAVLDNVVWPTVFTPMLVDGFNDDFVMGMNPPVSLKIFDRYGLLVVETADGWDGKYPNGQYAMPGVYYYVATFQNGDTFKGNVELLNEQQK